MYDLLTRGRHSDNAPRREFLARAGCLAAASTGLLGSTPATTLARSSHAGAGEREAGLGVLVDLAQCVGCRLCEYACKQANGLETGPLEAYDDQTVCERPRRPAPDAFTVVNAQHPHAAGSSNHNPGATTAIYTKINCMHCLHPACASACIVGALQRQPNGAVTYDAWKCIGCRYCMVACPFQIPAYDYHDAFTPQVRKREFCVARTSAGEKPACVDACPQQALTFGRRGDLLDLARARVRAHPGRYVEHIYGEHEVGGTSWLYVSPVPFERLGFLTLGSAAPPELTESIQHGVFKYGLPPLALYGVLGATMFLTRARKVAASAPSRPHRQDPSCDGDGAVVPEQHETDHDEHHDEALQPANRTLRTPGVMLLLALIAVGFAFGVYRFIAGLGASTNLDQQYPWGLWIAVDVASGVALAAGGFTSAFLAHVLHRHRYHAIVRPALLTAMLGYTFVVLGLKADLGRYYNVWHPLFMWQGNSVLFEVGMCVMCYLTVLYLEFAPIACEGVMQRADHWPRLARLARGAHARLERGMFLLIIAGCVLSCLHQSSLGNLLVITPYKLHPLWWTPILPLLFLLSAIAVGFPMVIWESLVASWSLKLQPEMRVLSPLARFVPLTLGIYLLVKVGDVVWRGAYVHLAERSLQSTCWIVEVVGGAVIPLLILLSPRLRASRRWLLAAASMAVLGVLFNRVNVFLIGYRPPFTDSAYVPWIGEFAVTIGLIAALMLCYRLIVTWLPVISQPQPVSRAVIMRATIDDPPPAREPRQPHWGRGTLHAGANVGVHALLVVAAAVARRRHGVRRSRLADRAGPARRRAGAGAPHGERRDARVDAPGLSPARGRRSRSAGTARSGGAGVEASGARDARGASAVAG